MPIKGVVEGRYNVREYLAFLGARLLEDGKAVFVGTGLPIIATMLAQKTHAPNLLVVFEAGGIGAQLPELPVSVGESRTFYRGIMAPETRRVGLQAQGFVVEPIPGLENGYRFRLVLVQIKKNDRIASGRVQLAVSGQQGGVAKTLEQADISADATRDFKYRFRYFQNIQGEWRFPPGFVPERVTVKAIPSRRGADPLEWTFEWPAEHPQAPA